MAKSEGPRFIAFWSKTNKRKVIVGFLITAIVVLASLALAFGDKTYSQTLVTNGTSGSTTSTNTLTGNYATTSLILIGIIVVVIFLPDIRTAKIGPIELELQDSAGQHGQLQDLEIGTEYGYSFLQ